MYQNATRRSLIGIEKECNVNTITGSPITIMTPEEEILKSIGLQKTTNKHQDVNRNEVKFRRKIPVNLEEEKNKQKKEILITERTA